MTPSSSTAPRTGPTTPITSEAVVGSELTSRVRVVRVERTREDVDWLAGRLTEVFDGARSVLVRDDLIEAVAETISTASFQSGSLTRGVAAKLYGRERHRVRGE